MAVVCNLQMIVWCLLKFVAVTLVVVAPLTARAQLDTKFYDWSCPNLQGTVRWAFDRELQSDGRLGASLLRMFFHDCFVQGCDASVLLDDTDQFQGEKAARPNVNSLRGFSAIDNIKAAVENTCADTVSCADVLALVARDAVAAAGGPFWTVELGRRDSTTASLSLANTNIPSPNSNLSTLTASFANVGLSQLDLVALSGSHTFGRSQCINLQTRLYNFSGTLGRSDPSVDSGFLSTLQGECPQGGPDTTLINLDQPRTPATFDNAYYANLIEHRVAFTSDQTLLDSGGSSEDTVYNFAGSQDDFFYQFSNSMINMGRICPLTGYDGEIRKYCRVVNS